MKFATTLIFAATSFLAQQGAGIAQTGASQAHQPAIQIDAAGQRLQLSGAGIRHLGSSPLYSAALYLTSKNSAAEDVLASPQAKQLRFVALQHISASQWQALVADAARASLSERDLASSIPALFQLGSILRQKKSLLPGDVVQIDWTPDAYTVIRVNGRSYGEPIEGGIERFNAVARIWLGTQPTDAALKLALLGQAV